MKALLIGTITAIALGATPAAAQPAPPPPPGVAQGTALPPRMPMPPGATGAPQVRMMVMSDHVMTRDEVAAHVREMFSRLDANHDGYVTREEADAFGGKMEAMRAKMDGVRQRMEKMRFNIQYGGPAEHLEDRGALFDRLDANHDGVISRQEFMNDHAQMRENRVIVMRDGAGGMPPMPPMRMHGMGMGMGMGGGAMGFGRLLFEMADTDHDGRVSLHEAEAAALAHFDRADLNHDGRITPDERQQMRTIRIERRPG